MRLLHECAKTEALVALRSSLSLTFSELRKDGLTVQESYHSETQSNKQNDEPTERVAVVRSAHGRTVTGRSFGALVRDAEHHERTTSNVRPFPQRPPTTSPTNTHNRRAA